MGSALSTKEASPQSVPTGRLLTSIDDVPASAWNEVVEPGDVLAEHWFARVCEKARIVDELRFLAVETDRKLIGAAGFFRMEVSLDLLADSGLRELLRVLRRLWPGVLRVPVTFCGLPVSFGTSLFRNRPEDARHVLDRVEETLLSLGREWRTPLLCVKECTDSEAVSLDRLRTKGWLKAPSLPGCRLDIRWKSIDEYLASVRAGYRRQWKAVQEDALRSGLRIESIPARDMDPGLAHRLYLDVLSRAPHRLECLDRSFFEVLFREEEPRVRVWLSRVEKRVVGMAIVLASPARWVFILVGLDKALPPRSGVYLALIQTIVKEAIDAGARSLELGQTSYDMKCRLGGTTSPRWIYVRARHPAVQKFLEAGGSRLFPETRTRARHVFRTES